MEAYQERVIEEHRQLCERLDKLRTFISTRNPFDSLPDQEQLRLVRQASIMWDYRKILEERIKNFPR